jgi:hypothetical protein
MRGGKRAGAGRPVKRKGSPLVQMTFYLLPKTARQLRELVPPFERSLYVNGLIAKAIAETKEIRESFPPGKKRSRSSGCRVRL